MKNKLEQPTLIITKIAINPEYEKLVPPMTKQVFESLVASIRDFGQQEPITVNDKGIVLDGHHRLRACRKLNIAPVFKVKLFANPLQEVLFVIDVNLKRRQLTVAQRVHLSLKKKPILINLTKFNQSLGGKGVQIYTPLGRVNELIAKDSGVSARQVSKVETILNKAPKDLKDRVLAGRTNVNKAYNQIRNEERKAELILEAKKPNSSLADNKNSLACHELSSCIQLHQGDFRNVVINKQLHDSSIELIFTDPPYDKKSLPLYKDLAILANRVLKEGGSLVTYFGQYALPTVLEYIIDNSLLTFWWQFCVMHSGRHQDRVWNRQVIADWKPLLWFVKGTRKKENVPYFLHDSIVSELPDKALHPWAQSIKEANHVIKYLTLEGQTVLDPFLGKGTTASASRLVVHDDRIKIFTSHTLYRPYFRIYVDQEGVL